MVILLILSFVRYIPLRKINFGAIILSLSSNSFVYSSTEPLKLLIRFYLRVQSYILFVMFIEAAQNICYWLTWKKKRDYNIKMMKTIIVSIRFQPTQQHLSDIEKFMQCNY